MLWRQSGERIKLVEFWDGFQCASVIDLLTEACCSGTVYKAVLRFMVFQLKCPMLCYNMFQMSVKSLIAFLALFLSDFVSWARKTHLIIIK